MLFCLCGHDNATLSKDFENSRALSKLLDVDYDYITSLEIGLQFRLEDKRVLNGHGYSSLYLRYTMIIFIHE